MPSISSICVYCGSRYGASPSHRAAAEELGRRMAEAGIALVYGGGRVGLMGAVADAVLAGGGRVTGIIPEHLYRREVGHEGIDELILVDSMHVRKQRMFDLSDAFVVLPGGIGTLDETFEILSWRQLQLHDKPVIVLSNHEYWQPFAALIDHIIVSGFADPSCRDLFALAHSVDEVFAILEASPPPARPSQPERL
jgi:uncharacterized protein (TIGR00730 family)